MWARKSTDNGATWLADMTFSDVVSPLPGQPDTGIVAEYVGDYDYGSALTTNHLSAWADGRVAIAGASQQDAFFDKEPAGGATPTPTPTATPAPITLQARVQTQGTNHRVQLKWHPVINGGSVSVLRNNVVIETIADDGHANDNLGTQTGTFTYQVCETGTGNCSNIVTVQVP